MPEVIVCKHKVGHCEQYAARKYQRRDFSGERKTYTLIAPISIVPRNAAYSVTSGVIFPAFITFRKLSATNSAGIPNTAKSV